MPKKVIMFLGIDGSGKSAHAHAVKDLLLSEGKRVKYVWMRRVAYVSIPLLGVSRLLGITKVKRFKDGTHWLSEYPFYDYRPLQFLWPLLQLVDSKLHTLFSISIPLLLNSDIAIIVDRGIIDTLIDVNVDVGLSIEHHKWESLFISSIPKNSFVIVFDVDEKIAIQRKSDIPSIMYLAYRRRLYARLARMYNWPIISTEDDFASVNEKLASLIWRGSN